MHDAFLGLLFVVHSACEYKDEQLPWLKMRTHVWPLGVRDVSDSSRCCPPIGWSMKSHEKSVGDVLEGMPVRTAQTCRRKVSAGLPPSLISKSDRRARLRFSRVF